jgi:hypothetical protein
LKNLQAAALRIYGEWVWSGGGSLDLVQQEKGC